VQNIDERIFKMHHVLLWKEYAHVLQIFNLVHMHENLSCTCKHSQFGP